MDDASYSGPSFRNNHYPLSSSSGSSGTAGSGRSTLVLVQATKQHGGRYLCQASNGVGAGLSKSIMITVHGNSQVILLLLYW